MTDCLTFSQSVNSQFDLGEISCPYFPSEFIESNPAAQHNVIDDPVIVGHVIEDPLEGCLPRSLFRC